MAPLSGKTARDAALEIYYAQRDFREAHKRWAKTLVELGLKQSELPAGVEPPLLKTSATASPVQLPSTAAASDVRQVGRIRQDRRLKLE